MVLSHSKRLPKCSICFAVYLYMCMGIWNQALSRISDCLDLGEIWE